MAPLYCFGRINRSKNLKAFIGGAVFIWKCDIQKEMWIFHFFWNFGKSKRFHGKLFFEIFREIRDGKISGNILMHTQFSRHGLNRLCSSASRFYATFLRISCKAFLESLKQTHSSCQCLIYWRNNSIKIFLRPLWAFFFTSWKNIFGSLNDKEKKIKAFQRDNP